MADFGVPFQYRDALTELAQLPEDRFDRLVDALASLPAFAPVADIRAAAAQALDVAPDPADELVLPLLALRGQIRNKPAERIAETLSSSTDLDLPADARERLAKRVEAVLKTEVFSTTGIGIELLTQFPRNYQVARIFTDIRPLFHDDVEDRPTGAVIVETLQIQTWNRDGGQETLFVAMDEADLVELQGVVKRALKKTATVRAFLEDQGIGYFELDKRGS
jgi:hypothetical protein